MSKYNSNSRVPSSAGSNVFAKMCIDPKLEVGVGKQMEIQEVNFISSLFFLQDSCNLFRSMEKMYLKRAIEKSYQNYSQCLLVFQQNFENTGLNVIVAKVDSVKNELT